ncbi:hypothetical protein D3C81_2229280 [compost metagenome]
MHLVFDGAQSTDVELGQNRGVGVLLRRDHQVAGVVKNEIELIQVLLPQLMGQLEKLIVSDFAQVLFGAREGFAEGQ